MKRRVLKELQLTHIAAVDRPCQEGALAMIMKRDFSDKQREKLADKGQAMPDGSYPIANTKDLSNAIQAIGRAKNPEATRRHIVRRARALGATDQLPEDWKVSKLDLAGILAKQLTDDSFEDFEKAFADVLDCMSDCDAADQMIEKFSTHKDAIGEIVADEALSPMGKHEELYEGLDAFVSIQPVEAQSQLEKALEVGIRLRALKGRAESLRDAAQLKRMSDRVGQLNERVGKVWSDAARAAAIEARRARSQRADEDYATRELSRGFSRKPKRNKDEAYATRELARAMRGK